MSMLSLLKLGKLLQRCVFYFFIIYKFSNNLKYNYVQDFENAYIKNANDQVDFVCQLIKNDTKLANGYHGLGISQGGQFL